MYIEDTSTRIWNIIGKLQMKFFHFAKRNSKFLSNEEIRSYMFE